jgi:DNA-directed RNA polymerase subunit F
MKKRRNTICRFQPLLIVSWRTEKYNTIGDLQIEITRLAVQIYAMNEICAPRNKAITSLLKLQNYGITDDEILNVYEYLNKVRYESAATIRR